MKIKGHRQVGLVGSFWFVYFSFFHFHLWVILAGIWFFMIGNTAPDTLELSKYNENAYFKRTSVIPHRTYTHWFLLWFCLFLISGVLTFFYHQYWLPLWAYSIGGLIHLLCDLPNPTGIPIIHPRKKRKTLNLWKSGENETLIFIFLIFISVVFLYIAHPYIFTESRKYFTIQNGREISQYLIERMINELKYIKNI